MQRMSPFVLSFALMTSQPSSSSIRLADLRCEYGVAPLGVEVHEPRLSWIVETDRKNWRQSAYQVLVASSPSLLAKDRGDLWDSGRQPGSKGFQIFYEGSQLRSRQRCFWKARVWDESGMESEWSPLGSWEMGLLHSSDWRDSYWIGGARTGAAPEPAPHLRKEFSLPGRVRQARLYISGLGYAEASINGKSVAPGTEREPGYTNFDKRVLYVVHDVTKLLKPGLNCIGAILGTGWYDVHDKATWNFDEAPWRDRPKLRALLIAELTDGSEVFVPSDGTWKASAGPIRFDGIYTGEVYDARLELGPWNQPGFDDSQWSPALLAKEPRGVLSARICTPVVITQTIKPKAIKEVKPEVYVLDLGVNISGHLRLKVKGKAGDKITLRYSERVNGEGMIDRSQIEQFMDKADPPQPFQTDVYICKGSGQEIWEQRFSYQGFRYVEITGFPGRPTLASFEGRFAHTLFEEQGSFECSNTLLNKIQEATVRAYLSNAQNIPTDCPQREKNGWTGDAHLASEMGLMNLNSASFYTKWLGDFEDAQGKDGGVPVIIPSGGWSFDGCHPVWDSAYAVIANEMADYMGDERILKEAFPTLKMYVDFVYSKTKDDLIPFDSLGDWLPWQAQTDSKLISSVMLAENARVLAVSAGLNGDKDLSRRYDEMSSNIRRAVWLKFYDPARLEDSTQTALALAVRFDLPPSNDKERAAQALISKVESQGHIDAGIVGAKHVLRALSEHGRTDLAYRIVARKDQPGWGWWIEQGATTLWEDWKGESSLNHIMFGDVSNWFIQWIAGIRLDRTSPAFEHILLRPQVVGDLTWAKGSHKSPYGWIRSEWKLNRDRVTVKVTVPAGSRATLTMPLTGTKHELGSGEWEFSEKR